VPFWSPTARNFESVTFIALLGWTVLAYSKRFSYEGWLSLHSLLGLIELRDGVLNADSWVDYELWLTGERGRLTAKQVFDAVSPLDDFAVMLCGSPHFVRDLARQFRVLGLPRERVIAEDLFFFIDRYRAVDGHRPALYIRPRLVSDNFVDFAESLLFRIVPATEPRRGRGSIALRVERSPGRVRVSCS
jgi:hypothetical protein